MKVFVTGATGFVGSAVTHELITHGYEVLGLARSERSADALMRAGASVLRGELAQTHILQQGADQCQAVIHTGFHHDFSQFAASCALDKAAIQAMGEAIGQSGKAFIVTAGVASINASGPVATEADPAFEPSVTYPRASEAMAVELTGRGTPTSLMRLPPSVHGAGDHGFVPMLIDFARKTGRSVYVGDGGNMWPAVHVKDVARAYRLALEAGAQGRTYHAVAEEGVPFKRIAEAISDGLGTPLVGLSREEAAQHFGHFLHFASIDQPASSASTREALGWTPEGPDLLSDIRTAGYFLAQTA